MIKSYKDLQVWQKSIQLADQIYIATELFPKHEIFGLSNQLRRAAVSVASNTAEGSVRSSKEFQHFIMIARGSIAEIETQLIIAKNRSFLSNSLYNDLNSNCEEISRMLMGLLKSLKNN